MLLGGSSNKYGNRLDGIEDVKISNDTFEGVKSVESPKSFAKKYIKYNGIKYDQSSEFLEMYFPKDKNIFIMCGAGGYAGQIKDMLVSLGWDKNKIMLK